SFRRASEDHPDVRTATVLGSVDQTTINASGGAQLIAEQVTAVHSYAVDEPRGHGPRRPRNRSSRDH
ncbi:hypothetical protein ACWDVV_26150, partial [Streptomyces tendae]